MRIALFSLLLLSAPSVVAQNFSLPVGFVEVTIPGQSLGVISATLANPSEHTGAITINDDFVAGTPGTQTITVAGVSWSDGQWLGESTPHQIYIVDGTGAEEVFLIVDNDPVDFNTLTISTDHDLLARGPAGTTGIITDANTLSTLFGPATTTAVDQTDNVYLWNGTTWQRYFHNGSNWRSIGFASFDHEVIHADEGIFVQRNVVDDLTVTIVGDVKTLNQVGTVPGPGLHFQSCRMPVGVTMGTLGYQNLPNWKIGNASTGDAVYVWSGSSWSRFYYNGTNWRSTGFQPQDNFPIPPDSAVFIFREDPDAAEDSGNIHVPPF